MTESIASEIDQALALVTYIQKDSGNRRPQSCRDCGWVGTQLPVHLKNVKNMGCKPGATARAKACSAKHEKTIEELTAFSDQGQRNVLSNLVVKESTIEQKLEGESENAVKKAKSLVLELGHWIAGENGELFDNMNNPFTDQQKMDPYVVELDKQDNTAEGQESETACAPAAASPRSDADAGPSRKKRRHRKVLTSSPENDAATSSDKLLNRPRKRNRPAIRPTATSESRVQSEKTQVRYESLDGQDPESGSGDAFAAISVTSDGDPDAMVPMTPEDPVAPNDDGNIAAAGESETSAPVASVVAQQPSDAGVGDSDEPASDDTPPRVARRRVHISTSSDSTDQKSLSDPEYEDSGESAGDDDSSVSDEPAPKTSGKDRKEVAYKEGTPRHVRQKLGYYNLFDLSKTWFFFNILKKNETTRGISKHNIRQKQIREAKKPGRRSVDYNGDKRFYQECRYASMILHFVAEQKGFLSDGEDGYVFNLVELLDTDLIREFIRRQVEINLEHEDPAKNKSHWRFASSNTVRNHIKGLVKVLKFAIKFSCFCNPAVKYSKEVVAQMKLEIEGYINELADISKHVAKDVDRETKEKKAASVGVPIPRPSEYMACLTSELTHEKLRTIKQMHAEGKKIGQDGHMFVLRVCLAIGAIKNAQRVQVTENMTVGEWEDRKTAVDGADTYTFVMVTEHKNADLSPANMRLDANEADLFNFYFTVLRPEAARKTYPENATKELKKLHPFFVGFRAGEKMEGRGGKEIQALQRYLKLPELGPHGMRRSIESYKGQVLSAELQSQVTEFLKHSEKITRTNYVHPGADVLMKQSALLQQVIKDSTKGPTQLEAPEETDIIGNFGTFLSKMSQESMELMKLTTSARKISLNATLPRKDELAKMTKMTSDQVQLIYDGHKNHQKLLLRHSVSLHIMNVAKTCHVVEKFGEAEVMKQIKSVLQQMIEQKLTLQSKVLIDKIAAETYKFIKRPVKLPTWVHYDVPDMSSVLVSFQGPPEAQHEPALVDKSVVAIEHIAESDSASISATSVVNRERLSSTASVGSGRADDPSAESAGSSKAGVVTTRVTRPAKLSEEQSAELSSPYSLDNLERVKSGKDTLGRTSVKKCNTDYLLNTLEVLKSNNWPQVKIVDYAALGFPKLGRGIAAASCIAKNTILCGYGGKVLQKKDFISKVDDVRRQSNAAAAAEVEEQMRTYRMDISNTKAIDGSADDGAFGRLMNHNRCPKHGNVRPVHLPHSTVLGDFSGLPVFASTRDVDAEEQLFWDYGTEYGSGEEYDWMKRCAVPGCNWRQKK